MVTFLRVATVCRCRHPVPVRLAEDVVLATRGLPKEAVIATYKCRRCGSVDIRREDVIDRKAA